MGNIGLEEVARQPPQAVHRPEQFHPRQEYDYHDCHLPAGRQRKRER
ncbi:MAG: hypothetical protein K0A95_10735 [Chromatiales bacterium]|nr:hypothetical protein [Chromatiales bacterium]